MQRSLSNHGLNLVAELAGQTSDTPVVLLHGGGQTRYSWQRTIDLLAESGYYVVAPDLRGHGESDWSKAGHYTLDHHISDTVVWVASLATPPVFVGASLGGVISLVGLGERLLEQAAALVLVDVVPRLSADGVQEILNFMSANPHGFSSLEEARDAIVEYLPSRKRTGDVGGLRKNLRKRADGRYYWHWDPKIHESATGEGYLESMALRMESAAKQIHVPTLVLRGGVSRVVDAAGVSHLADLIPHAQFVDVENAEHMIVGDQNDAFNASILNFLSETLRDPCSENHRL